MVLDFKVAPISFGHRSGLYTHCQPLVPGWLLSDAACAQHMLQLRHLGKGQPIKVLYKHPYLLTAIGKDIWRAASYVKRTLGQQSGDSGLCS